MTRDEPRCPCCRQPVTYELCRKTGRGKLPLEVGATVCPHLSCLARLTWRIDCKGFSVLHFVPVCTP